MMLLPFCLILSTGCAQHAEMLSAVRTDQGVEIREGDKKVLFYQTAPKSLNGKYERTNYVHPLYSLEGNILTEDFPDDHPHHRGVFWAWHQIIYNDKPIADGWSCENVSWEVIKTDIQKKKDQIALNSEVVWRSFPEPGKEEPIIREHSRIIVHRAHADLRVIDFEIELDALKDGLRVGGSDDPKGYGGFSVRFKLPDDIVFSSKEKEVSARELAIEAGPWMDFSGSFEDGNSKSGVALFCHPDNPGYPEPWILRKAKSMQNPAYPGREPVTLTRKGLRFQYRLVLHKNTLSASQIQKLFEQYAGH